MNIEQQPQATVPQSFASCLAYSLRLFDRIFAAASLLFCFSLIWLHTVFEGERLGLIGILFTIACIAMVVVGCGWILRRRGEPTFVGLEEEKRVANPAIRMLASLNLVLISVWLHSLSKSAGLIWICLGLIPLASNVFLRVAYIRAGRPYKFWVRLSLSVIVMIGLLILIWFFLFFHAMANHHHGHSR